ncbi:MAG: hypothetical protein KatS3mg102_2353 [Planctomycetota bacterium]|nr:MAG: hypothetical protein KatS3mg102_2353 [Planctomycetota bacterium]
MASRTSTTGRTFPCMFAAAASALLLVTSQPARAHGPQPPEDPPAAPRCEGRCEALSGLFALVPICPHRPGELLLVPLVPEFELAIEDDCGACAAAFSADACGRELTLPEGKLQGPAGAPAVLLFANQPRARWFGECCLLGRLAAAFGLFEVRCTDEPPPQEESAAEGEQGLGEPGALLALLGEAARARHRHRRADCAFSGVHLVEPPATPEALDSGAPPTFTVCPRELPPHVVGIYVPPHPCADRLCPGAPKTGWGWRR